MYDEPLPGVHGGAGPRPAAPRVPDARGHAVLSVPGALTRHTLHTVYLLFVATFCFLIVLVQILFKEIF